jgi:hypothetical protein
LKQKKRKEAAPCAHSGVPLWCRGKVQKQYADNNLSAKRQRIENPLYLALHLRCGSKK